MARSKRNKRAEKGQPLEIPMTDLEASRGRENEMSDPHAAGTPAGGTAIGGLAGTNSGRGEPDELELEEAFGSGVHDTEESAADEVGPFAGHSGGAVGGTPAEGRASGGHMRGGLSPGNDHPGDTTVGSDPATPK